MGLGGKVLEGTLLESAKLGAVATKDLIERIVKLIGGDKLWKEFLSTGVDTLSKDVLKALGEKGIKDVTTITIRDLFDKKLLKELNPMDIIHILDDVAKIFAKENLALLPKARKYLLNALKAEGVDLGAEGERNFLAFGATTITRVAPAAAVGMSEYALLRPVEKFRTMIKKLVYSPALKENVKYPLIELEKAGTKDAAIAAMRNLIKAVQLDVKRGLEEMWKSLVGLEKQLVKAGLGDEAKGLIKEAKYLGELLTRATTTGLTKDEQVYLYKHLPILVNDVTAFEEKAAGMGFEGKVLTGNLKTRWEMLQAGTQALGAL